MTVCIMAIVCVWFALMLLVSSNNVRISRDEITIVQNKVLAQGALTEAMLIAEQAAQAGALDTLPATLVQRSVAEGELSATWQMAINGEAIITAQGRTANGRYTLSGRFVPCILPDGAGNTRPLLLADEARREAYLSAPGYDYVLKDDHGGMVFDRAMPLMGNVYCYGNGQSDQTVTVRSLVVAEQEMFVQGHLYVQGDLQVQRLLVTGDVYLADASTLACSEMWVGGELLGKDAPESLTFIAEPTWRQTLIIKQLYNLSDE